MTTPTAPPIVILPKLLSTEFVPPGTPSVINAAVLPPGVERHPGPYNKALGTLFILAPNASLLPGSKLQIYADHIMHPNGALPTTPSPTITFTAITINSNTAMTRFRLPYKNKATNADGFDYERVYDIYGEVADPAGNVYGYLRSLYGCWLD